MKPKQADKVVLLNGKQFDVPMFGKLYSGAFHIRRYKEGNRIAVEIIGRPMGEPLAMLTVNIPEIPLEPDEIIVKTWSENEDLVRYMINTGWFKDTGKRVPTGYCEAQIWKVQGENP